MVKMKNSVLDTVPECVFQVLNDVGISSHLSGYSYIAYALEWVSSEIDKSYSVTKELYPVVASAFGTTPTRVERSIRHAIESIFARGGYEENLDKYFGNTVDYRNGKVTNSQFIASLGRVIYKKRKDLIEQKLFIDGTYKKLDPEFYSVMGVATNSETKEKLVVYESLVDNKIYATPLASV